MTRVQAVFFDPYPNIVVNFPFFSLLIEGGERNCLFDEGLSHSQRLVIFLFSAEGGGTSC